MPRKDIKNFITMGKAKHELPPTPKISLLISKTHIKKNAHLVQIF